MYLSDVDKNETVKALCAFYSGFKLQRRTFQHFCRIIACHTKI